MHHFLPFHFANELKSPLTKLAGKQIATEGQENKHN